MAFKWKSDPLSTLCTLELVHPYISGVPSELGVRLLTLGIFRRLQFDPQILVKVSCLHKMGEGLFQLKLIKSTELLRKK